MTMFNLSRTPTLIGYAEMPRDGNVSVWLDRASPTERKVYIALDPIRYDDAGLPIGLRPAPKDITIAAGYGVGVKLEERFSCRSVPNRST